MNGLTEVKSSRSKSLQSAAQDVEIILPDTLKAPSAGENLLNKVADNMPQILSLVSDIVELKKIQVQTDAVIKQMESQRKLLLAEAEAYALRKNADTNDVVQRMNIVREMMNDYYLNSGNSNISSEDFRMIISDIVMSMNKVTNG